MLADPRRGRPGGSFRGAVAAPAGHREGPSRSELLSELRREPRRGDAHGNEAVLQQPRHGGPQRARPADAPTTRSSTSGSRATTASRASVGAEFRRVTYPDASRRGILGQGTMLVQTLAGQPHLAGAARQVGDGSAARHAAATAAARRARSRGLRRGEGRPAAHDARADGDPSHERDLQLVPPVHGSDRPGARQLRRHGAGGATRENGMPLDTTGDFYDGTRVTSLPELTALLMKRPTPLVRNFAENLMAYGLGRRVEYFDQPTIRAIAKAAEAEQLQDVVVHPRRGQERRLPDAASGTGSGNDRNNEGERIRDRRSARRSETMHFMTGKHMPRRTFLRGAMGATVALPFLDAMVAAKAVGARRRSGGAHPPDLHRGGARPRRLQQVGRQQVPVRAGADRLELHDPAGQRAVVARAVPRST